MAKSTERHLILGGNGFIGRQVAQLLVKGGHEVILASRSALKHALPPNLEVQVERQYFDLEQANWDSLIEGVNVVHHYAWSSVPSSANVDPASDLSTNVLATLGLLEALKKSRQATKLVFASSGGTVYGKPLRVPVQEEHNLNPITAYGAGKAAVEMYLGTYRALYGLDCRVARMANVFGAGQDPLKGLGAVTTFIHRALRKETIVIWGDGEVIRDFIHVSDVAAGLVTLASAPPMEDRWAFNIGSGHGVSLKGILAEVEFLLGHHIEVKYEISRKFDILINVLDISLIREALGWQPILSFSEGVAKTFEDLRREL